MRSKKVEIYILTALLLATAIFFGKRDPEFTAPFFFVLEEEQGGSEEKIQIWEQWFGAYVVFLPSYAELSNMEIRTIRDVYFDDMRMSYGTNCGALEVDRDYQLSGRGYNGTIRFIQSQNIPAVYIDTASGSMEQIHKQKDNKESGRMRMYLADGTVQYRGNLESVKMHGNNTEASDKKPYNLKLSSDGDLLESGKAKNWILLSNLFDPSHIRNKAIFDFAKNFGLPFTPEAQWVDLYLNGNYAGLYLLSEKNEVHPQRVSLGETGSFLVSMELRYRLEEQNLPHVQTDKGASLRIRNSDMDAERIEQIIQSAENAIWAEDGIDPGTGKHWSELIDMDSWARKYLIEEVFGNVDGGCVSQFFYVDGDDPTGKIYAGPVWDYDLTMANTIEYKNLVPNMLYVNCPAQYFGSPWYEKLCQDELFFNYLMDLYQKEFLPLLTETVDQKLEQYASFIGQAAFLNQTRWEADGLQNIPAWEELRKMETYLAERIAFLNRFWAKGQNYCLVSADYSSRWLNFALFPGEYLPELPDDQEHSWYILGTETVADLNQPIYQDLQIERKRDPAYRDLQSEETFAEPPSPEQAERNAVFPAVAIAVGLIGVLLGAYWRKRLRDRAKEQVHV